MALILVSCSRKELDPYAPHETLLSITAEYQLLTSRNPYEDQPLRDATGQHIARSTLLRLSNFEALDPDRFPLEILILKARAYEWLGDHELAADLYREAARTQSDLQADSQRRYRLNQKISELEKIGSQDLIIDEIIRQLSIKSNQLQEFASLEPDPLYQSFAWRASEKLDVTRSEILATNRYVLEGGEDAALELMEEIARTHNESARRFEHVLRLAKFHRELAEEEIRIHPPTGFDFDSTRTLVNLEKAMDLLYRVSQADGFPEKLVAARELDTVLLIREQVIRASR